MRKMMKRTFLALAVMLAFSALPGGAAEKRMLETFDDRPETRWRFIVDTVMGEVSTGKVDFLTAFGPSGWLLADTPGAASLTSADIVAFGRDHGAKIEVREVGSAPLVRKANKTKDIGKHFFSPEKQHSFKHRPRKQILFNIFSINIQI